MKRDEGVAPWTDVRMSVADERRELLQFNDDLDDVVYGTRREDGAWVHWFDGEEVRLDEEYSETFRNLDPKGNEILTDGVCESYTVTQPARVPTAFCEITPEAAAHFMTL